MDGGWCLDQGSDSGGDEKLPFSGHICKREPTLTGRRYIGCDSEELKMTDFSDLSNMRTEIAIKREGDG